MCILPSVNVLNFSQKNLDLINRTSVHVTIIFLDTETAQ